MTRAAPEPLAVATDWRPRRAAIEAIVAGRHNDPFAVLGPHRHENAVSIRVMAPAAQEVEVVEAGGRVLAALEKLHDAGFFAGLIEATTELPAYRLRFRAGEAQWEEEDAYRFPHVLGEMDVHQVAEGTHRRLYEKLGAHPITFGGIDGTAFAVWRPMQNA